MSGPASPTTSGTSAYNPVATKIITKAFRHMAVINDTEEPDASMFRDGLDSLNSMMKELQATGIHVWTEEEAILFLQQNQVRYLIGGTTSDHIADAYSYVQSSLSSNAPAGATALILADASGLSKDDQFGVVLDTGAAFWTTVSDVPNLTTNSVPLTDALPSSVSAQNFCFGYTDNIVRPLKVPEARRLAFATAGGAGPIETPLTNMLSRQEYMDLPNKYSPGTVTQAFYNPARDQGQMYVWPKPSNAAQALRFTWYRPLQDFLDVDNTADLPQEWNNTLEWNLAKELSLGYSVPPDRLQVIMKMASDKYDLVAGWDREAQPVYFGMSYDETARD